MESSCIWTLRNVFSSRSWRSEGPHMRTQAERESHWWWEMVSWTVFLNENTELVVEEGDSPDCQRDEEVE